MKSFFQKNSQKLFTGLMFGGVGAGVALAERDRQNWESANPGWKMEWRCKGVYAGVPLGEWVYRRKEEDLKAQDDQDRPGPSC